MNLITRWHDGIGLSYEADPWHAQAIIQAAGVQGEKGAVTPVIKITKEESDEQKHAESKKKKKAGGKSESKGVIEGDPLAGEAVTKYRAAMARGNYLASDRPDIAFAVKECARQMATPTNQSWSAVERLARYLITQPRLTWRYKFQPTPTEVVGFSDSGGAGRARTRRSTSGGPALLVSFNNDVQQHTRFNIP